MNAACSVAHPANVSKPSTRVCSGDVNPQTRALVEHQAIAARKVARILETDEGVVRGHQVALVGDRHGVDEPSQSHGADDGVGWMNRAAGKGERIWSGDFRRGGEMRFARGRWA